MSGVAGSDVETEGRRNGTGIFEELFPRRKLSRSGFSFSKHGAVLHFQLPKKAWLRHLERQITLISAVRLPE
jgi:hypothetical protein